MLSKEEKDRYARQILIEGWGEEGQERLKNACVFIAGAGGLGSPVSMYLAAAGVGHLKICDFDSTELSNLNRQILHGDSRLGMNKAASAKKTLESLNPHVKISALHKKIEAGTAESLIGDADIAVDCMDNFATRYLLNWATIRKRIPLVHGSVWGMDGRVSFFHPPDTPCLECVFPEAPPTGVFPVVGVTPAVIGSLQALETLKYLTGTGLNLKSKILCWEGGVNRFQILKIRRNPSCPACSGL